MTKCPGALDGTDHPIPKAKIFCGFIFGEGFQLGDVLALLAQKWGEVEFISRRLPFDSSRYYEPEMGTPLFRKFVVFREEADQDALAGMKRDTRELERLYSHRNGARKVNIDPGLLMPERVVLATTKARAHRPYLGKGIYVDLTLLFENKSYRPLEWTYPDYAAAETVRMLNGVRTHHLLQKRVVRKWAAG